VGVTHHRALRSPDFPPWHVPEPKPSRRSVSLPALKLEPRRPGDHRALLPCVFDSTRKTCTLLFNFAPVSRAPVVPAIPTPLEAVSSPPDRSVQSPSPPEARRTPLSFRPAHRSVNYVQSSRYDLPDHPHAGVRFAVGYAPTGAGILKRTFARSQQRFRHHCEVNAPALRLRFHERNPHASFQLRACLPRSGSSSDPHSP